MIKGIIFDLGGVIADLDYEKAVRAFKNIGFEDISSYLDPSHQKDFLGEYEAGKLSEDEFYKIVLGSHCNPGTSVDDVLAAFREFICQVELYKIEYIKRLQSRGLHIFALTNNNPSAIKAFELRLNEAGSSFDELFEQMFISFEMKMMKPSSEIFNAAIEKTGLEACELLFIDDSLHNVEGAKHVGMHALKYNQGSDIETLIENYLSQVN